MSISHVMCNLQRVWRRLSRCRLSISLILCLTGIGEGRLASASQSFLSTSGSSIVDQTRAPVVLRGVNLAGGFEIEPWMSGFDLTWPARGMPVIQDESTLWTVLTQRFGAAQTAQLQMTWRSSWVTPSDIATLASIGANVVRIPFFYQVLESDANPNQLLPQGLALIDALLAACAQNGVYAILDMHGAPGGQSAELTTGQAGLNQLFTSPAYQQQTVNLWAMIAAHYANHPEVAGYDLLNEPMGAPDAAALLSLYGRIYDAIRAVDPQHILFMQDGYRGLQIFSDPAKHGWTNVAYSIHVFHLDAATAAPFEADIATRIPAYVRMVARLNAPLYIGAFSTEATAFSRPEAVSILPAYLSALNQSGFSWTPFNYKIVNPITGTYTTWGLFTNLGLWRMPDPYNDSFADLEKKFAHYQTANLTVQPDLRIDYEQGFTQ